MDNAVKWWDTQYPVEDDKAVALRKFGETEKQRESYERSRKVTLIVAALFVVAIVSLYAIIRGAH